MKLLTTILEETEVGHLYMVILRATDSSKPSDQTALVTPFFDTEESGVFPGTAWRTQGDSERWQYVSRP